ncbi:IRX7 [Symbiodinium pilosum]|uniref:IRX7 protein n=1 Tax=Symbiodinium pilosum TaxID=2952 RepID=A0A812Q2Y6_SYMPI|nr:IRX7 [Symbiodinium pilosum]
MKLLRAGAEPTRQNLSCFVNQQGDVKRTSIAIASEHRNSVKGLPCRLARTEQLQSPLCRDHKAYVRQFPSTFADPYLCDAVPLCLFLLNDNKQTPLEVLLSRAEGRPNRDTSLDEKHGIPSGKLVEA